MGGDRKSTILVIENDAADLETISGILADAGYAVLVAADAAGAMETARENQPDLVLMSAGFLGVDGFEAGKTLAASLREKEALLKGIHHRVKNDLQIISSLLSLQADYISDPLSVGKFMNTRNRIMSISVLHEVLCHSADQARVDIDDYVTGLLGGVFGSSENRPDVDFRATVEKILLPVETAIPCGLAITELVMNSLAHAFPSEADIPAKRIDIDVRRALGGEIALRVADNGVGLPMGFDPRAAETLGMRILLAAVDQLRGDLATHPGEGAAFTISFTEPGS